MSKHREETIAQLVARGVSQADARTALRQSGALDRLAQAVTDGLWPADDGNRRVVECSECRTGWAPISLDRKGVCQDCRTTHNAERLAAEYGAQALTQGDPRGATIVWRFQDGSEVAVVS